MNATLLYDTILQPCPPPSLLHTLVQTYPLKLSIPKYRYNMKGFWSWRLVEVCGSNYTKS